MPKLKTHKGMKKRFKVSATGKVSHKRCGSSHLNEPQERQAGPPAAEEVEPERLAPRSRRIRNALLHRQATNPLDVEAAKTGEPGDALGGGIPEAGNARHPDGIMRLDRSAGSRPGPEPR